MTKISRNQFIYESKKSDGTSIPVIGYVIAWSYNAKDYPMTIVENIWKKYNLDITKLQKGQQRISAVLRALQKAKQKSLLREIEETPTYIRYQLTTEGLSEDENGNKYIKFEPTDFITYDKTNDSLTCSDVNKQNHLNALLKLCSETWSANDITRYTKALFDGKGIISLRERGGMYFVPAIYRELVLNVYNAFKEIDTNGIFTLLEMPDLNHTKESIASNFENDIQNKIEILEATLKELQEKSDKIHGKTTNHTVELLGELTKEIEMYSDLTELQLTKAKELVQKGQTIFKKYLTGEKI